MKYKKKFYIGETLVEVNITMDSNIGSETNQWYGTGVCKEFIKMETYDTQIGTIQINHIEFISEDNCYEFTFAGKGIPRFL